jgi:homoserine O-succinyltransferase
MVIESQIAGARTPPGDPRRGASDRRVLTVGFVNNMPDAAFEDTYRQFAALLSAGDHDFDLDLRGYWLPHVPRSDSVLEAASLRYEEVSRLYANPPDALVVTGLEPGSTGLATEAYWDDLARLLRWAEATVPSTILSCLASHAATLALDGISRRPLPAKQSGVFEQEVDVEHFLGRGLPPVVSFPHSRYNDIPVPSLSSSYRVVVASPRSGWTVATRTHEGQLFVLLQGHPEYGPLTLLKEYRRDVKRFLEGTYRVHPDIPVDYLDPTGVELLEIFRARCARRSTLLIDHFPYEEVAQHTRFGWEHTSRRLFTNWITDAAARSVPVAS